MTKVDLVQGTEAWLKWRKEGITATDMCVIMGTNKYKTQTELKKEKLGEYYTKVNEAMLRGTKYEDEARKVAQSVLHDTFEPCCLESSINPLFRASLDGLSKNAVLEIKVPTEKTFAISNSFLEKYYPQLQWQMMIAEKDRGYLFIYHPERVVYLLETVQTDALFQEEMKQKALAFWESVMTGSLVEGEKKLLDSPYLKEMTLSYRFYYEMKKAGERGCSEIKESILAHVNNEPFMTDELQGYVSQGSKSYDMDSIKEFLESHGYSLSQFEKKGEPSIKLKLNSFHR